MTHCYYPAIFQQQEDGTLYAEIAEMPNLSARGKDVTEVVERLKKCIGDFLFGKSPNDYPPPEVPHENLPENTFVALVEYDERAYNERYNSKSVTRAVTLPFWMNEMAKKQQIPVSNLLQKAILRELDHPSDLLDIPGYTPKYLIETSAPAPASSQQVDEDVQEEETGEDVGQSVEQP